MSQNNIVVYSDFDILFRKNAMTGDVIKKTNLEDIKQSLGLLLRTRFYDRCWHPEIGSYLPTVLFNQDDEYIKNILIDQIENLIKNWEPRIKLENIKIYHASDEDVNNGRITIQLDYIVKLIDYRDTYIYTVSRLR